MRASYPATAVALTIAGSDSGGGAGIQADLRAFNHLGVHGCSAIAALTAQNPRGVSGVHAPPPEFLALQMEAVFDAFQVGAVKTGMLFDAALIGVVADALARRPGLPLVVDPVMVATSGSRLLKDSAIAALRERLLPRATVVTPNVHEAEILAGRPLPRLADLWEAGPALAGRLGCAVLFKGGHCPEAPGTDLLVERDGRRRVFRSPALQNLPSTHGTGCTLSAALAAGLAQGRPLDEALRRAKAYLGYALRHASQAGEGTFVWSAPVTLDLPADGVRVDDHL